MEHDLEDDWMENVDGRNRYRSNKMDSIVSVSADFLGITDERASTDIGGCQWISQPDIMTLLCRNAHGCPWPGKLKGCSKISAFAENLSSQIMFFIKTKPSVNKIGRVQKWDDFQNGIDVPADCTRGGLSLG